MHENSVRTGIRPTGGRSSDLSLAFGQVDYRPLHSADALGPWRELELTVEDLRAQLAFWPSPGEFRHSSWASVDHLGRAKSDRGHSLFADVCLDRHGQRSGGTAPDSCGDGYAEGPVASTGVAVAVGIASEAARPEQQNLQCMISLFGLAVVHYRDPTVGHYLLAQRVRRWYSGLVVPAPFFIVRGLSRRWRRAAANARRVLPSSTVPTP